MRLFPFSGHHDAICITLNKVDSCVCMNNKIDIHNCKTVSNEMTWYWWTKLIIRDLYGLEMNI